jgi:hypothetical protein
MLSEQDLTEIRNVTLAVAFGEPGWAQMPAEDAAGLARLTDPESSELLWYSYVENDGVAKVTAITGNGPHSMAGAKFFSGAPGVVLALLDEISELREELNKKGRSE